MCCGMDLMYGTSTAWVHRLCQGSVLASLSGMQHLAVHTNYRLESRQDCSATNTTHCRPCLCQSLASSWVQAARHLPNYPLQGVSTLKSQSQLNEI